MILPTIMAFTERLTKRLELGRVFNSHNTDSSKVVDSQSNNQQQQPGDNQ